MPEIRRFYGIVFQMHATDHEPPHFHARYAEHKATIAIADGAVMAGSLPRRALRLVVEWAEAHRSELERDWRSASLALPLDPIEPLR